MTDETKGDGMTLDKVLEEMVLCYGQSEGRVKAWIEGIAAHLAAQSAMRVDEDAIERGCTAWFEMSAVGGNAGDCMRAALQAAIGGKG